MDRNTGSLQSAENDARQKQAWNLRGQYLNLPKFIAQKVIEVAGISLVLSVGYMTSAAFTAALL